MSHVQSLKPARQKLPMSLTGSGIFSNNKFYLWPGKTAFSAKPSHEFAGCTRNAGNSRPYFDFSRPVWFNRSMAPLGGTQRTIIRIQDYFKRQIRLF